MCLQVSPDKEDLQAATAVPAAPRYVVLVSGFKDTDEDALKEFFQSRRHSGGGPVDNIDFRKDTGEAVVTFLNEAGRYVLYNNIVYLKLFLPIIIFFILVLICVTDGAIYARVIIHFGIKNCVTMLCVTIVVCSVKA